VSSVSHAIDGVEIAAAAYLRAVPRAPRIALRVRGRPPLATVAAVPAQNSVGNTYVCDEWIQIQGQVGGFGWNIMHCPEQVPAKARMPRLDAEVVSAHLV
jgi:hypothetical protein